MSVTIGSQLGSHEITALLGKGGMGEVYRARDSKLKRDVAIKILPPEFSGDSERVVRFQREAEVLASLNHPGIAAIYELQRADGQMFLVMEYVPGETLAERINKARSASPIGRSQKEGIPIDEALEIGKQICEALEAAHEKGIVHRDLKPANIKITPEGKVKVLDFGLAKAYAPQVAAAGANLSHSPTMMTNASMPGVIMGTAAYMSPEQAKGKEVDKRTDIFAFGCVLYEMLSGKRAFDGDDVSEILSSIIKSEPDWTQLPAETPLGIRNLLRACLEKNIRNRRGTAADVRIDIDTTLKTPPQASPALETRAKPKAILAAAALLGLAGVTIAGLVFYRKPADSPLIVFEIRPPKGTTLVSFRNLLDGYTAAISPDGQTVAFLAASAPGKNRLYIRPLASGEAHELAGTEGALAPFWSPDNRQIGFFTTGAIKTVDVPDGGIHLVAANAIQSISSEGAWSPNGTIVFAPGTTVVSPLLKTAAEGGTPAPATKISGDYPSFLPDGRHFLFSHQSATDSAEQSGIYIGSLDSTDSKWLMSADSARFAAPGYLLFIQQFKLYARAFDPRTFQLSRETFHIADDVAPGFAVSDNGVISYRTGSAAINRLQLAWYDRSGKRIENVGSEAAIAGIDVSPDGKRIAVHRHEGNGGDIWILDPARQSETRLTFDASHENVSPIWSPDGTLIAFGSNRSGKWGIYEKKADGSGAETKVFESDLLTVPMAWSPDGKYLVLSVLDPKTLQDLWILPLAGGGKATPFANSRSIELFGQVSPNGRWIAYTSTESGGGEIYVRPFPTGEGRWQISRGAGTFVRWRADGKELFYLGVDGKTLRSATVDSSGATFQSEPPRDLFEANVPNIIFNGHQGNFHIFAVSPDGQRFLFGRPPDVLDNAPNDSPIHVILNWTRLLKK